MCLMFGCVLGKKSSFLWLLWWGGHIGGRLGAIKQQGTVLRCYDTLADAHASAHDRSFLQNFFILHRILLWSTLIVESKTIAIYIVWLTWRLVIGRKNISLSRISEGGTQTKTLSTSEGGYPNVNKGESTNQSARIWRENGMRWNDNLRY